MKCTPLRKARLNVIEVVADIDDAVWRQVPRCGYGAGQNLALVAAAIGAMGEG